MIGTFYGVRSVSMPIDGSRSNFPNSVDRNFTELFDLPFNKINEAHRLTELKGKSVLTNDEQNEVINLTNSLKEYMITPETFNYFQDALVAIQEFFYSNVQGFIEGKQVIWDSYIKSFKFVGKWQTAKKYGFQNMVTNDKGDLFICLKEHTASTSITTANTTYWQQASAKGDKGDTGLSAIYRGEWKNTTAYVVGDVVRFGRTSTTDGVDYICINLNTGKSPATEPTFWGIHSKLFVGSSRPDGAGQGLHFIKVV